MIPGVVIDINVFMVRKLKSFSLLQTIWIKIILKD